jgi:hypothetical protein
MELVVGDQTYIIRQVSSPDMKALRGGITEENPAIGDQRVAQLQDFQYQLVDSILVARKCQNEHRTQLELRRQCMNPYTLSSQSYSFLAVVDVGLLKRVFPELIAEHDLTDAELRCYNAPVKHRLFCPFCRCAVHNISGTIAG